MPSGAGQGLQGRPGRVSPTRQGPLAFSSPAMRLAIPGRVTRRRPVLPVHLGDTHKGVAAADSLVLARAAHVLKGSGPSHRVPGVLPRQVGLVALDVANAAVAPRRALLLAEIRVEPRRALDASAIKQAALAL